MRKGLLIALAALVFTSGAQAEPYLSGFVEGTQALRVESNDALDGEAPFGERAYPRSEVRAELQISGGGDRDEYFLRTDFVADQVTGESYLNLREAYAKLYVSQRLDVKIGRQVATWGTGDLLFANDLFAKDWGAFFTGMDLAYLKVPQDMLRVSIYTGGPTLDLALSPNYTMDNLPTGLRLSLYNPFLRELVGEDQAPTMETPPRDLHHGEIYGRLYGYSGSTEWALYGYSGYFPTPLGAKTVDSVPVLYAPQLASGGASVRRPLGGYLLNAEGALYYSQEDPDGTDPMLPNSSVRFLTGVEKNLGRELTASVQWFGDWMLHYDLYRKPFESTGERPQFAELRNTVALRLTKFYRNQTVKVSFFGYWGINDKDYYVRPYADYDFSDAVRITLGLNWVGGDYPYTTFGQFQNNSNVYGRVRYSF